MTSHIVAKMLDTTIPAEADAVPRFTRLHAGSVNIVEMLTSCQ